MTTTTAPNAQAWLAKEATPLGPFVVRLDGDRIGSALTPGHWVVVVDAQRRLQARGAHPPDPRRPRFDDALLRQAARGEEGGLARRHRADASHRARHATAPRRPVGGARARRRLVAGRRSAHPRRRLRARSARAGDARRSARPRQRPRGAGRRHERSRPLPRRQARAAHARGTTTTASEVEPAAAADEEDDSAQENDASLHEPGAEFNRASGRVEPDDDALDEIDTTNNQSLVPSSLGLTFCVGPDVKTLDVTARWGSYARVPKRGARVHAAAEEPRDRRGPGDEGEGLAPLAARWARDAHARGRPHQATRTRQRAGGGSHPGRRAHQRQGRAPRHAVPGERPARARDEPRQRVAFSARAEREGRGRGSRDAGVPASPEQRHRRRRRRARPPRAHLPAPRGVRRGTRRCRPRRDARRRPDARYRGPHRGHPELRGARHRDAGPRS